VELYLKVRLAVLGRDEPASGSEAFQHIARQRGQDAVVFDAARLSAASPIRRPKLDAFVSTIEHWLDEDRKVPRKQRHTAKRVFDRLRDEHGFTGGYTIIKDYMRERDQRARRCSCRWRIRRAMRRPISARRWW
jgi:transposase